MYQSQVMVQMIWDSRYNVPRLCLGHSISTSDQYTIMYLDVDK